MGAEIPKQFMKLEGKPVIMHTIEKFFRFDPGIRMVLVLASDHLRLWESIASAQLYGSGILLAPGGETRYESVRNGLHFIEDGIVVGIHDAVRPLVSLGTLERCYNSAAQHGSGIPVTEMDETVRMTGQNNQSEHLDRSRLRRVQTPQVFQSKMIKEAYLNAENKEHTDDASVFELLFKKVSLVEGNRENIKITTPTDLQLASILIRTSG